MADRITLEHTYDTSPERVWELWTTAAGIGSWSDAPYEFATLVELQPDNGGTRVVMTLDPLHDEEWTQRLIAGRENELENLATALS